MPQQKKRIARNKLTSIQGATGEHIFGNQAIGSEAERHFQELFTSSIRTDLLKKILNNIHPVVTNEMNDELLKDGVQFSQLEQYEHRSRWVYWLTAAFYPKKENLI